MKKISKKQILLLVVLLGLIILSGCQKNTDANGYTLAEKVIYLDTPWKQFFSKDSGESFISTLLVYPLAQAINYVGQYTGAVLAVIIVTVVYSIITLPMSIKSTASTQKIQMIQPEMQKIQEKYAGKEDDASKMAMTQEMQKLCSKYGINPLGGSITPFLQFPILIAMYNAVQRASIVCQGTFAGIPMTTTPSTAFKDLAQFWPIFTIFILMIIAQFLSTKIPQMLAEQAKKKQKGYKAYADQGQNPTGNFMMIGMIALVAFVGFNWPISMSVYWLINSIVNVAKTIFIQRKYVEHE